MNKTDIFALKIIVKNSLFSVKYRDEEKDELGRLFDDWTDIEFLESFFETHINDLNKEFYTYLSIEDAVEQTLNDVEDLETRLIDVGKCGQDDKYNTLETLFKPLNNNAKYPPSALEKSKVYGSERKSWLRIYALRLESNVFVITGGAIKLTRTMNNREHLLDELDKLEKVKQYLITESIIDNDSLIDFFEI